MNQTRTILFLLFLFSETLLFGNTAEGKELAKKLHLNATSKAIMQWERVFTCKRKIKRYKIDTLTLQEQKALKQYLVEHAIDSDHPTVAGE